MAAITSGPQEQADAAAAQRARPWTLPALFTLILVCCDALAINLAASAVYLWHLQHDPTLDAALTASARYTAEGALLVLNLVLMIMFIGSGLYTLRRGVSRIDEAFKTTTAISLGAFSLYIINGLLPQFNRDDLPINAQAFILCWAAAIGATVLLRFLYRSVLAGLRANGIDTRRVLIVGAREPGRTVLSTIYREPELGYRVQGFLSDTEPVGSDIDGALVIGLIRSLSRVIRATRADEVIIALSGRTSAELLDVIALAEDEAVDIKLYPDSFQLITNNEISVGDLSGLPLISVKNVALSLPINSLLKRALDLLVAGMVLTLASPLMLLIALLIKLESRGPTFFVQDRVGLDGESFPTLKFRTMRVDAPDLGNWTTRDDPRITRIGTFLRRYSLDELPQFINVILGEMSVVGPRPEQPIWVEKFAQQIPRYMRRHKQKAGITGWAQVNGLRGDTSIEERTRYDLYYVENWSLLFDLKIIIKTVVDILAGQNQGQ